MNVPKLSKEKSINGNSLVVRSPIHSELVVPIEDKHYKIYKRTKKKRIKKKHLKKSFRAAIEEEMLKIIKIRKSRR